MSEEDDGKVMLIRDISPPRKFTNDDCEASAVERLPVRKWRGKTAWEIFSSSECLMRLGDKK